MGMSGYTKVKKNKWFSITAKDFKWSYYRGSGNGGQKRNKTENAVRCQHRESGALGACEDHREKDKNKREAFSRCVNTKEFQSWLNLEIERRKGNVKIEGWNGQSWENI